MKTRAFLAVAAALLASGQSLGQDSRITAATTKPLFDRWEQCIVERAKRYARSPDSAEFIVKTAVSACGNERRAMGDALKAAGVLPIVSAAAVDLMEQDFAKAAALEILEVRSTR